MSMSSSCNFPRLVDADQVTAALLGARALLADVYRPAGIDVWMNSRNRELSGAVPKDLIAAGRSAEVLAVIHRLRHHAECPFCREELAVLYGDEALRELMSTGLAPQPFDRRVLERIYGLEAQPRAERWTRGKRPRARRS